jgi:NADH-quinone oxidoreductase subunit E
MPPFGLKNKMDLSKVEQIVKDHNFSAGHLIGILQDVQAEYHYLPKHPLEKVAELLKIPLSQVFSVATFFRAFSLEPRGEKEVHVCLGTACHVRGAKRILEELERGFDLKAGQTSKDMKVTLETVMCVGACALGPVVVVNNEYHGRMDATKTSKLIEGIKGPKK